MKLETTKSIREPKAEADCEFLPWQVNPIVSRSHLPANQSCCGRTRLRALCGLCSLRDRRNIIMGVKLAINLQYHKP